MISKINSVSAKSRGNISVKNLEEEISVTLSEFDLKPDWLKKIPLKKSKDSLKHSYRVRLPKDLPVTVILNEINLKFGKGAFRVASRETETNKRSIMRIFYGKALLYESEFVTDTSISRNKPVFGFMINDIEKMNDEEIKELLAYPEKFSILLVPSQRSEALKKLITDSGREFTIMVRDENEEVRFRLDESYSRTRLNGSISNLIKAFGDTQLFIKGNFNNSNVSKLVDDLFKARKIRLASIDTYPQISELGNSNLSDNLNSRIRRSELSQVFIISSEDFISLIPELRKLRKLGYKFVIPSAINYGI